MSKNTERKEAWNKILIFLAIVTVISSLLHYALVTLYPSRIYIGTLMWCPAIAAFLTLRIKGLSVHSLQWKWASSSYTWQAYLVPALYGCVTYGFIWLLGFGDLANAKAITAWAKELKLMGIGTLSPSFAVVIGVVLLATTEVIRSLATTLGEEIGWRGFFIIELRKVMSFTGVSLVSGIIWASWHWPVIVYYGNNVALEMSMFFIVIISMSFIMAYYTFKAKSLWPAAIFHAVSNVYIQKILPPLTTKVKGAEHWLGENGVMFAIVTLVFGLYFWRKAIKEQL
jgi:membrane protease YdiL (CAAX protease family)